MVILLWLCLSPDQATERATTILAELYQIRVEQAELERDSDLLRYRRLADKCENLENLQKLHVGSRQELRDLQCERDLMANELRDDEISIRQAKLQLELIQLGINAGAINLDDLKITTELLRRR